MASGREIKTKIKSVQNTRKVTRALEMVSASKIRKAQERMQASLPYVQAMKQVATHLVQANIDDQHPFLLPRPQVTRVGYIVMSSDRGLAGGLNSNLFRQLLIDLRRRQELGVEADLVTIGLKASQFFRRLPIVLTGSASHLGEAPKLKKLLDVVKVMFDAYLAGRIDRIYLVYNEFINTMVQKAKIEQLLPLPSNPNNPVSKHHWDYLYEPDPASVLEQVMTRYIESLVYQALLENIASEHAARMVAMKAASDNANKMIGDLQLSYNKARQAAITQEISEIVGGAAAV